VSEQKRRGRRYPRAPEPLTRTEQIEEALALLAPSPEERKARRHDVESALDFLEGVNRAVEHAKVTKKSMLRYSDALLRMQAASKAHTAAGGSLALRQDQIDRAVAVDKAWSVPWQPPSPWLNHKESEGLAHQLLSCRDGAIAVSRDGTWHRLSTVLFGDRQINLYRHLRAFAAEIRRRKK
jgi:hypothetical protein